MKVTTMGIGTTVAKGGTSILKEGTSILGKHVGELTSKIAPAAKAASDRIIIIGRDVAEHAPSFISKHPLLSVGLAGVGGAGAITGTYMTLEKVSPHIPGDFNFAFGSGTPSGNIWKPYDPEKKKFVEEKKDMGWVKYVAIGGVAILGIGVLGNFVGKAGTTISLIAPGEKD